MFLANYIVEQFLMSLVDIFMYCLIAIIDVNRMKYLHWKKAPLKMFKIAIFENKVLLLEETV